MSLWSSAFGLSGRALLRQSRTFTSTTTARNTSQPSSYKQGMAAYRTFAGPFAKVFLGAVFTYQVIYQTWMKLEMDESKLEKNEEVAVLEKKAREMAGSKK
ncbi:hypothetical protein N7474_002880 [Penicillium riverlandense]|uniref:uncharacterized protein n=1 Tax=Penicillium riverlandense TaxID=1903569 RepID=UPI0025495CCC|nr:uncharacterized protein N7474_002880 [Penicillium riverlandense]KAJ5825742.1 hypothetical protein N7474_002880 [Penicillium riverlandense]